MKTRPVDWREEKRAALAHARLVIIKIGSAVLTDPSGLCAAVLENIATQMAALRGGLGMPDAPCGDGPARRLILVSSAAVAAGRATLARHERHFDVVGLAARQAAAAVGQGQLMRAWDRASPARAGKATGRLRPKETGREASCRMARICSSASRSTSEV